MTAAGVANMNRRGRRTAKTRLFRNVVVDLDGGCWQWIGCTDGDGYGRINIRRAALRTHTVMWWLYVGEVPAGLTLDHLCRNTSCCNPGHLEPVTRSENVRRELLAIGHHNAKKTHCPVGHPYNAQNTGNHRRGDGRTYRRCLACNAARKRAWRARQIEPVLI